MHQNLTWTKLIDIARPVCAVDFTCQTKRDKLFFITIDCILIAFYLQLLFSENISLCIFCLFIVCPNLQYFPIFYISSFFYNNLLNYPWITIRFLSLNIKERTRHIILFQYGTTISDKKSVSNIFTSHLKSNSD